VLAVFAILFGVATSLGLGTRQLNSGLNHLFGVPEAYGVKIAIIALLMGICTVSAITGLGRGIRLLSLSSLVISGVLLLFVLAFGPTLFLLNLFTGSLGEYLANFLRMSFDSGNFGADEWSESWTFFFWAWWISWSPFVGSFIARISYGRTIRGVVLGAMLAPSALSFVWFSVFGGMAINLSFSGGENVAAVAQASKSIATFETLGVLPLPFLTSLLIVFMVALYFITSADSASFMLGSVTSGGSMRPRAPVKLLWSFFGGAFAAVLLLSGGREALHGAAIIAGVPFTLILVLMCVVLCRCLFQEEGAAWEKPEIPAEDRAADERRPESPVNLHRDY
jgi:glycine betaine transporter